MSLAPFLASPKIRRFLIFIGTLLITSVVIADPASCPGVRCLPMITGNWQFIYGPRYASFDAVIAAAQASFNNAYAPCTITISPNNELPALEATTALNGVTQTTGDTWWSIYQTYGTKYDIRWYSLGTFSESG